MNEQKISSRARLLAFPAVGAALLGVSVVGRNGGSAQNATGGTPEASPSASPVASPQAEPQTSFDVDAGDIFYSITEMTAPANTDIEITLTNIGVAEHDLVIEDTDFRTSLLKAGESETITVNLPAGEYVYYCSVPGHRAVGMEGILTIVETDEDEDESESETGNAGADSVSIEAGDIYFSKKELSIPADTDVEITVTNVGVALHDFEIENTEFRTAFLNGGQSETITVNLPAGEYVYFCSVPGHRPAGMVGTLTVS